MPAATPSIVEAATVLCVRAVPANARRVRTLRRLDFDILDDVGDLGDFVWHFSGRLEVLMGQGEIVNWVRSSQDEKVFMRYPGEMKFAGGSVDAGESLVQAASRELAEEFMIDVPIAAKMRPFDVKQTRVVQGRSYTMFNFVALASDPGNEWLASLNVGTINAHLAARRREFQAKLNTGEYWLMNKTHREAISPEVRSVGWFGLAEAVEFCLTSKARTLTPVNDFQRTAFADYGIAKRDPMFATMYSLLALERVGGEDGVRTATSKIAFEQIRRQAAGRVSKSTSETREHSRSKV